MNQLKIINSPIARILTQCTSCNYVMKTTADNLYYLVDCPECQQDFIVKRYQPSSTLVQEPEKTQVAAEGYSKDNQNEAFIKAVYHSSWPIYKTLLLVAIIWGTASFGISESFMSILITLASAVFLTIAHFCILCFGGLYLQQNDKLTGS